MTDVHMIFRMLLHLLLSRFGPRMDSFDVAHTRFRVVPSDLDIYKHMNNGVYLSIFDVGRFDLLVRSGVLATLRAHGWYPVVVSETITFRKSLTLWTRFTVESRIPGFDEKAVYMEQRAVVDGAIYAQAIIRGRFLRRSGGTVPVSDVVEATGPVSAAAVVPRWLLKWGADAALPTSRADGPSVWN